jgi:hypothetical protein
MNTGVQVRFLRAFAFALHCSRCRSCCAAQPLAAVCLSQDAHNLAWKLALVLDKRAPAALLDS